MIQMTQDQIQQFSLELRKTRQRISTVERAWEAQTQRANNLEKENKTLELENKELKKQYIITRSSLKSFLIIEIDS